MIVAGCGRGVCDRVEHEDGEDDEYERPVVNARAVCVCAQALGMRATLKGAQTGMEKAAARSQILVWST